MILEIVFDYQKISNMMEYTYVQKMSIVKVLLDIISVDGKIDTTPLITHRFPLAKIAEAYELFEQKRDGVIKVAITQ